MPCFAEPHKYCLCGVLLMAIENEHKEGICMKIIKRITFLLFILSVIVFLDLAHNYFNATFTELHDGIMLTGFFSKIIYGDNSWSLFRFYNGFITSLRIVSFLGILNIALAHIERLKKNPK